mgnify:CR=1 FL=1
MNKEIEDLYIQHQWRILDDFFQKFLIMNSQSFDDDVIYKGVKKLLEIIRVFDLTDIQDIYDAIIYYIEKYENDEDYEVCYALTILKDTMEHRFF